MRLVTGRNGVESTVEGTTISKNDGGSDRRGNGRDGGTTTEAEDATLARGGRLPVLTVRGVSRTRLEGGQRSRRGGQSCQGPILHYKVPDLPVNEGVVESVFKGGPCQVVRVRGRRRRRKRPQEGPRLVGRQLPGLVVGLQRFRRGSEGQGLTRLNVRPPVSSRTAD